MTIEVISSAFKPLLILTQELPLLLVENDRLGYLSFMFIFGIIVLLFSKFRFKFFIISAAILITVNLFFTLKTTHYWKRSTQIYNAYLENFDSYTSKNVYLLGVPDNYKGIWIKS